MSTQPWLRKQALGQVSPLHALQSCPCWLPHACGMTVEDFTDWREQAL